MVAFENYVGREQAYVKHIFLESYLERLAHKAASYYPHIVYIDGFAGPWQSKSEKYEDTSFGIALRALNRARETWKGQGRDVSMSAYLVERDNDAYQKLVRLPETNADISIRPYAGDFVSVLPSLVGDLPAHSFAFFFVDPKGWAIRLRDLSPLLERNNSEVVFNFMFDFINRAVSIQDPKIMIALGELIPFGDWRTKLDEGERMTPGGLTPELRKNILVEAFRQSLKVLGKYQYVAETTVLRPVSDRPLYSLCYATRHPKGIEVFRDSQIKALREQSSTRATTKIKSAEGRSGQMEFFRSLHEMGPIDFESFLKSEEDLIEHALLKRVPKSPGWIFYEALRAQVLEDRVVKFAAVNNVAARMRKSRVLLFPDWQQGKRVPQGYYRVMRS
jgi:three-Cys-motif partner protein